MVSNVVNGGDGGGVDVDFDVVIVVLSLCVLPALISTMWPLFFAFRFFFFLVSLKINESACVSTCVRASV